MSFWHCEKCGGIPGVTNCCSSNATQSSAQIIQLDDHRPQITITTHANKVHVIPVAFWMDVAKGHQTIDNLGDLRDSILRVVLGEWLVIKGVAEPEQLLTLEIGPCPDDS